MALPSIRQGGRWIENYQAFECVAVRIRGPVHSIRESRSSPQWIYADVWLPDQYAAGALARCFNPDGTYTVEVPINWNRKTLAAFLASGDLEWNVGGVD